MTLELQTNLIKVNRIFFETSTKNIMEEDIIVPDSKPDVVSILQADAQIKVKSKEIYKDMMVIRGTADFKILYLSDDASKPICSIDYGTKFDYTVDVQNIDQEMKAIVDCNLEHLDCNILNGRKLNIKSILDVGVKVTKTDEVCAVSSIAVDDNIQTLNKTISIFNNIEYEPIEVQVQYEAEIPMGKAAIKEFLKTDAVIKDKEVKVTGNKAMVRGNIEVSTLYIPDIGENKVEFVVNEVPFSEMLDIEDIDLSEAYSLGIDLDNMKTEVKEDDDGDSRVIEYEMTLRFKPQSLETKTFEVLSDTYSISSKLECSKDMVKINQLVGDSKVQLSVKENVDISNVTTSKQIYNIIYKPVISEIKLENDKLIFNGSIDTVLMYLSNDESSPFSNYRYYVPFKHVVDIQEAKSNIKPEVRLEVDSFNYNLKDNEVEMKFNMTAFIRTMYEELYEVITKIDEVPIDAAIKKVQPSMTVYYVQTGDTLWNIAKKYMTTVNEIIRVNNMEIQDVVTGQQLLIPKAV